MQIYIYMMSINSKAFSKIIIIVQLSQHTDKMMKLVVFSAVLAVALGAFSGDPKDAKILRAESDSSPEGGFQYAYETENGISAQETGVLKPAAGTDTPAVVVQGNYQYEAPDGSPIRVEYVADENGFQPAGDALPTPPPTQPIPPAILRALEYIAAHPQKPETRRR